MREDRMAVRGLRGREAREQVKEEEERYKWKRKSNRRRKGEGE